MDGEDIDEINVRLVHTKAPETRLKLFGCNNPFPSFKNSHKLKPTAKQFTHTFNCMKIIDFEDSPLTLVLKKRLGATRKTFLVELLIAHGLNYRCMSTELKGQRFIQVLQ